MKNREKKKHTAANDGALVETYGALEDTPDVLGLATTGDLDEAVSSIVLNNKFKIESFRCGVTHDTFQSSEIALVQSRVVPFIEGGINPFVYGTDTEDCANDENLEVIKACEPGYDRVA